MKNKTKQIIEVNNGIKATKQGGSHYFLIRPSKVHENLIDPQKKYNIYAEEVQE